MDNKTITKAGLAELGPMKIREKNAAPIVFVLCFSWAGFSVESRVDKDPPWQSLLWRPCLAGYRYWKTWLK
ncbi:anion permease [Escherichia coli]|nr:anion permease [Escherichia coli]